MMRDLGRGQYIPIPVKCSEKLEQSTNWSIPVCDICDIIRMYQFKVVRGAIPR
jgi:hypothetical protein